MALPTLVRNWQFAVNQLIPDLGFGTNNATSRRLLRTIKNLLVGGGGATWLDKDGATITPVQPWTVISSCNLAAAGNNDGVDRWNADSDITWAAPGSAHSWFVIQQSGMSATFQLLIDCNTVNTSMGIAVVASHTGFGAAFGGADGTTTAAPTALNSNTVIASGSTVWGGYTSGSSSANRIHVMRSADGKGTRVLVTRNGLLAALWFFDLAGNPATGWSQPYLCFGSGTSLAIPSADSPLLSVISGSAVTAVRSFGSAAFGGTLSCEGPAGNTSGPEYFTTPNSYSAALPLFPVGFMSTASGNIGRHGILPDFWFGLANQVSGNSYPAIAPLYQFVQASDFVLPWNKTIPNFTGI